jgi:hypothetical protein
MSKDPHQHQRNWLGEIQGLGGILQDPVRVVQVGVDVGSPALTCASE